MPTMPNSAHPELKDWLSHLRKEIGKVDENTYFVGHSLGPIAILKFFGNSRRRKGRRCFYGCWIF